jgi:hypothetical protein
MITFKSYISEAVNLDKLTQEFVKAYGEDARNMYKYARESYLSAVENGRRSYNYPADLNHAHKGMTLEQFQDTVAKHFFPYLKKHKFPAFASKPWGEAEQEMRKAMFKK